MEHTEVPKVFIGSHNTYIEIAHRGMAVLGFSLHYLIHPETAMGILVGRFVVHAPQDDFGTFDKLKGRGLGEFRYGPDEKFNGMRFQRLGIPLFLPGPPPFAVLKHADKFCIWTMVADWLGELCAAEGYTMENTFDLPQALRSLVAGEYETTDENLQLMFSLPTLKGADDGD
jgi:hypothetical protein